MLIVERGVGTAFHGIRRVWQPSPHLVEGRSCRERGSEPEAQPFLLLLGVEVCIGNGSVRHSFPSSSAIFRVVDK
jgi:hypothetical protein